MLSDPYSAKKDWNFDRDENSLYFFGVLEYEYRFGPSSLQNLEFQSAWETYLTCFCFAAITPCVARLQSRMKTETVTSKAQLTIPPLRLELIDKSIVILC